MALENAVRSSKKEYPFRRFTYTYWAANEVFASGIIKATIATTGGRAICKNRSPVLSACQALIKTTIVPMRYGGVVSRSVSTVPFPRPAITLRNVLVLIEKFGETILTLGRRL